MERPRALQVSTLVLSWAVGYFLVHVSVIMMQEAYHKPLDKRLQIKEMKFPFFQNMIPYRLWNNYNMSASIFWTNLNLELACSSETSVTTYLPIYMVSYTIQCESSSALAVKTSDLEWKEFCYETMCYILIEFIEDITTSKFWVFQNGVLSDSGCLGCDCVSQG
jgi:hypothetical protein